jgi:hypothetical protein
MESKREKNLMETSQRSNKAERHRGHEWHGERAFEELGEDRER